MKVKIKQIVDFLNVSLGTPSQNYRDGWMNQGNNSKTQLGDCIRGITPSLYNALKPLDTIAKEYNMKLAITKASFANTVEITESAGGSAYKYSYTGENLIKRDEEMAKASQEYKPIEDSILDSEVEIEPVYVDIRPARALLSEEIEKIMTGFVINPEPVSKIIKV